MNAALIIFAATINLAAWPLAKLAGDAQWWHYILQGLQGFVLWVLICRAWPAALPACIVGAGEAGMVATCGAQAMVVPVQVWPYGGICDGTTGIPISTLALMATAAAAAVSRVNSYR